MNGINIQEWYPSIDKCHEVNYVATIVKDAKPSPKVSLQVEVGLHVNPNIPIIGYIGR